MTNVVPWWLECTWLKHRHAVEEAHQLFEALQDARGPGFMTVEHVLAVLEAEDPAAPVQAWIGGDRRVITRRITGRFCLYPGCQQQKAGNGPASKYCAEHAALRKRQATRDSRRQQRSQRQEVRESEN